MSVLFALPIHIVTPMFFFQFEVRPQSTHSDWDRVGGAIVNCWIVRATQDEAEAVARQWIADEQWNILGVESAAQVTPDA
jgi:hypothetical protein